MKEKQRTANSRFAKGGISCSTDSFGVNESLVLRINICAKKPARTPSPKPLSVILKRHRKNQQTEILN